MLKFEGVKKHYEDFELDLTLEVPEGYVTGLIGANGAGKSTAFKAALGLIRPDAGVVKMLGKNVEDFTVQDKEWIGVVLADSGFSGYLRVKDILPMLESMYHKFQKEDFLEMCKKYQLPLDKKIKEFSTGMNVNCRLQRQFHMAQMCCFWMNRPQDLMLWQEMICWKF